MKKVMALSGGILIFFLFLGAGCADQNSTENENIFESKSAEQETDITVTNPDEETGDTETQPENTENLEPVSESETTGDEFSLKAVSLSNGTVKLTWNIPENMAGESIRIYRGPNENPGPTVNYWVNPGIGAEEYTWNDLSPRTEFFRLCQWQDNQCVKYSENVSVEIQ
ncbi:MAG: hypothetical protein GF349_03320 [Candidatus Magasanikbacteria bacterium]|nr:hypothetical protein [Candidatus Magasanikbacteria bacterium]